MTSRERVYAALEHKVPDRTPVFEYVLQPPVADAVLGRDYIYGGRLERLIKEQGWEKALRAQARDIVSLAEILGHDLIYMLPNPMPPDNRGVLPGPPPYLGTDPVREIELRVESAEGDCAGPSDNNFIIYMLVRQELERVGLDLPVLAPACAHGIWTDTALMQVLLLAPELARRHFKLATRRALARIKKYASMKIDIIVVGGDFAGNSGPLISPGSYREFIMPEVRALSREIHRLGRKSVNASDGNLWPVIENFLLGCEVDGYIEIDLRAGMELDKLKKAFGAGITFFGNLDCANLMSFGTPEQVKEHTLDCLEKGGGDGGHILCCNNAITGSVPVENYMAVYSAYGDYFGVT